MKKAQKNNTNWAQPIGVESNSYQNILFTYHKPKLTIWQRLGGLLHVQLR